MLSAILSAVLFAAVLPAYNPSTETTLQSNVIYAGELPTGVYVIVKDHATANGQVNEIMVHLAPAAFLANEGVKPAAGDAIKIVGSRVTAYGADTILAREVTVNGKTITLRDASGSPRW